MRRLVVILVVVLGSIGPVYADDLSTRQEDVRQQLAAAAAQISDLNVQMATLERSATDTQQRIERERAQVRILARALYTQPDSLVALIFQSSSLTEAMTRIADLTSAGDRAAATKRALDRDLARLAQQRGQLQADRDRQLDLKRQLEAQYAKLIAQANGLGIPRTPATPPPPLNVPPGSVSAIQQIILDAFAPLGGAAQQWALRVAKCESGYNPYAVNRSSGASGLFQFLPATWAAMPQHNQSVFDPVANAQAAAYLYNRSGPGQWQCK
jgi:Transglycosylase SLT domain